MDLDEFKQAQQQAWEDGDYRPVGRMLAPAAHTLVDRVGIGPGDRVLDVATGSGSVAIEAARSGAEVVGIDHTDAWFDEARRRADEADVSVALQVGDAEDMPVDGHPEHVRELFAPHDVSLQFETRTLLVTFTSTDGFEDFVFENSGPLMAARRMLEDTGRWDEAHTAWRAAVAEANEATDGTYRATWEYLLVLGTT